MKTAKERIVWNSVGSILGIPSTQEPYRVFDCSDLKDGKPFYQVQLQNGNIQVFYSKDDLLKTYPHVKL